MNGYSIAPGKIRVQLSELIFSLGTNMHRRSARKHGGGSEPDDELPIHQIRSTKT